METDVDLTPRKSFLRRFWWIFVVLAVLIIAGFAVILIRTTTKGNKDNKEKVEESSQSKFAWPDPDAKYITAVPVDLTQIQSISLYRSCAGHIRDGYNFDRELETDRSMKHYFYPLPAFQGTLDQVKVFAPFDGTIIGIDYEKDKVVPGRTHNGGGLHISPSADKNAAVVLGHIYTVQDYKIGDTVSAGELVGYASLGDKGNDFDIDLNTPGGTSAYNGREVLGSIFDHMTPEVLAEFAKYGITSKNTKFTKAYRDANLCGYNKPQEQKTDSKIDPKLEKANDPDGHHNSDNVQLTH